MSTLVAIAVGFVAAYCLALLYAIIKDRQPPARRVCGELIDNRWEGGPQCTRTRLHFGAHSALVNGWKIWWAKEGP